MSAEHRTQRYRTEDVQSDAGSFSDLLLPQPLVQALAAAGFVQPSPVQKASIPIGRVGTDLIVQAKSGTGKTAVFATLLLDRVDMEVSTPQAIVLAPTRELAIQSFQVIGRIAAALPQPSPSAAVFVGGLPTADDEKRLRRVCHIAVGSPGRLCGLITSGALLVGKIKAVVLDEADQLLSESFYADTAWLLQQLPKRKQVLAFSATYTPDLLADLEPLMRRPHKVLLCEETVSLLGIRQFYQVVGDNTTLDSTGDSSAHHAEADAQHAEEQLPAAAAQGADSTAANGCSRDHQTDTQDLSVQQTAGNQAEQQLSIAEQQQLLMLKVEALLQLLSSVSFHQAVIFCNRKPAAEWLARRLTAAGCPAAHLSGDLPQTERMAAMESVRGFKVRVIVSTDVMARGVDFDRVNLVVNVDLPPDAATYVHRVGRTGRFGSRGIAVALLSQQELTKLQQYLLEVKGGDITPLPDVIPADLYSFELTSDWEKAAYQQLLAAPTCTPPDSPPPLRKKKPPQQQQQCDEELQAPAASSAAAATLSALGYEESALSYFDWEDEEEGQADNTAAEPHHSSDPQPLEKHAGNEVQQGIVMAAETGDAGRAGAAYDPAEAWEAWAAYYRSLGYDYQHANPYLSGAAAAHAASLEEQQQFTGDAAAVPPMSGVAEALQQHGPSGGSGTYVAATEAATTADAAVGGAVEEVADQAVVWPQHDVIYEEEEEVEECGDEWELPDEDDVDERARLLLSRLHVTQEAAAVAGPGTSVDPGAAEAAGVGTPGQHGAQPSQQQQQQQAQCQHQAAEATASGQSCDTQQQQAGVRTAPDDICWQCWATAYTAWQQQYTTWQQQFSAWYEQYQQQQHQQWQQYSSWCEAYQQQLGSQTGKHGT